MRKLLPFLFLAACGTNSPTKPPTVPPAPLPTQAKQDNPVTPAIVPAAAKVTGDNAFAASLYAQLKDKAGNLFFSPASVRLALGMTYAGARGDTAKEMEKTLALDGDPHAAFGALQRDWNGRGDALKIVNRLWGEKQYSFLPAFLSLVEKDYAAPLERVDLRHQPEPSRKMINQWVEKQTNQKIKDLLPPDSINASVRLVLTNAVYFKADWVNPFTATNNGAFNTANGAVNAKMMSATATFKYADTPDAQVLEMPYSSGDMAMVVVLPKGAMQYDASSLPRWTEKLAPQQVAVVFPRFETSSKLRLNEPLKAMGMPSAFDERADFSGMDGTRSLSISDVFHQGFVKVNEKGTEASAATAVVMTERAMPQATRFVADKPFLFFIRDTKSGSVLFMGRIVDPTR
jgi:serpin B